MIREGQRSIGGKFIVATETGILHRLRRDNPSAEFLAANESAVCRFMKTITPAKLTRSLREGVHEVTVDPEIAGRARRAIRRMIEIA